MIDPSNYIITEITIFPFVGGVKIKEHLEKGNNQIFESKYAIKIFTDSTEFQEYLKKICFK